MSRPNIVFNTSSGSDTQASGAGPSTAVFGTNASFSGSVWTLDGSPDLSGVATDGTHVLWAATSTGRQFFTINAVNNSAKTVTTDDAPSGTSTGRTWAIGGKRNDLNATSNRTLFNSSATNGAKGGWHLVFETDQTISSAITMATGWGDTTDGPVVLRSDSTTVRTITQSANAAHFTVAGRPVFKYLKFANSNGTKTSANALTCGSNIPISAYNCVFGDATSTIQHAFIRTGGNPAVALHGCTVIATTSHGINFDGGAGTLQMRGGDVRGCGSIGINVTTSGTVVLDRVRIWGNTGDGITKSGGTGTGILSITNCTIHANGGDGLDTATTLMDADGIIVAGNSITQNGAYGWNAHSRTDRINLLADYNNYGTGGLANTSGARNNVSAGANDLAVDPQYVNASSGDFTPGNDATWTAGPNGGFLGAVQFDIPVSGGGNVFWIEG